MLLHGFTGSAEAWGGDLLAGLSGVGRVLAADLPGHGENRKPTGHPDPASFEFPGVVNGLVREIVQMGFPKADWVGYSMGGRIALAIAAEHPDRVRRLVLESASPGLESARERSDRRKRDDALAERLEAHGIEPFVEEWMEMPLFASQKRLPATVRDEARRLRLRNDPRALAAVLRGMGTGCQPSYWDSLERIDRPVLLLTGGLDRKFEAIADRMASRLPAGGRISVGGAGHAVHLEDPERWIAAVTGFLGD